MLLGQLLIVLLSAAKRFDAVVLHAWSSARDKVRAVRGLDSSGELDVG
jgi:hypothetical protein